MNKSKLISKQIKCVNCGTYVTYKVPKSFKDPKLCKNCMQKKHFRQMGIKMDSEIY